MVVSKSTKSIAIRFSESLKQEYLESQLNDLLKASITKTAQNSSEPALYIFDLSQCYWYDIGALLWLLLLLHRLKKNGNDLQLILPDHATVNGNRIWSALLRWRFFHALAECVDDPLQILEPNQIGNLKLPNKYGYSTITTLTGEETTLHSSRLLEITPFSINSPEHSQSDDPVGHFLSKFSDKIVINALSSLCGWKRDEAQTFVHNVVGEGIRNCSLHSNGTFLCVGMTVDHRHLTLAIVDNGLGIPASIRGSFAGLPEFNFKSDAELIRLYTESNFLLESYAILLSVRPGISSSPGRAGMGLHYLKNTVLNNRGELRIRSGTAHVDFDRNGEHSRDELLASPGTLIRIRTPLAQ